MPVNAIDANIVTDHKTGDMYMLYGSFRGECHMLLLDKETGQGITCSVPMKLGRNGYYECCSVQGRWKYQNQKLNIEYGNHKETAHVYAAWDFERKCPAIAISGISADGLAFMAKRTRDI